MASAGLWRTGELRVNGCSCAVLQTWQGHRRARMRVRHASQRPSGPALCTASRRRQPSARRRSSVRATGSSVDGSALSATSSSVASRASTARRVSSMAGHTGITLPDGLVGRRCGRRPGRERARDLWPAARTAPRRHPEGGRARLSRFRPAPSTPGPDRTDRYNVRTSGVQSRIRHRPRNGRTGVVIRGLHSIAAILTRSSVPVG